MKATGFAFVFMEDDRDADDAIHALDQIEFGRNGRRLRVEWTKHERSNKRPESTGRSSSNLKPSKTLFVINFDPYRTRTRDLERHFDRYGKILNVRIRKNFAFVQFESQEDATRALDATNMGKLFDRVISVEYAVKDDDDRRNGYSPARGRGNSPRRGYDRVRSPSPHRRERDSPDYGHGRGPRGRSRSRSPHRSEGASPDYAHGSSPSPRKERHPDYNQMRSPSPTKDRDSESDSDHCHNRSRSPSREYSNGDNGRGSIPRNESPGYGRGLGSTPKRDEHKEKAMNPDDYTRNRSPAYSDAEMHPCEHEYGSQSPWAQESS